MTARRWWRQPLLHFIVLGACVFAVHAAVRAPARDPSVITLTPAFLRGLAARERTRLGREPSPAELAIAREAYITEEVLYREALSMGLDRGDPIIRQRLVQKMEFLAEDAEDVRAPTEDELRAFVRDNPSRYALPARVTVEHVFVRAERPDRESAVTALRAQLAAGASPEPLGDPFPLGRALSSRTEEELTNAVDPAFVRAAMSLETGRWSGPVVSRYGTHLLRVTAREPARPAAIADVRDRAREDLLNDRRAAGRRRALAEIRARYTVR